MHKAERHPEADGGQDHVAADNTCCQTQPCTSCNRQNQLVSWVKQPLSKRIGTEVHWTVGVRDPLTGELQWLYAAVALDTRSTPENAQIGLKNALNHSLSDFTSGMASIAVCCSSARSLRDAREKRGLETWTRLQSQNILNNINFKNIYFSDCFDNAGRHPSTSGFDR